MTKTEEAVSFSPREMEVLALAWQCFESEPKIDIKKLARLTGYTEGSASVTIGKIKRKLKVHAAGMGEGNVNTTSSSTPKKVAKVPKSSKRTAGGSFEESPSKKTKAGSSTMSSGANAQQDDDEGEDYKIKPEPDVKDGYNAYDGFQV